MNNMLWITVFFFFFSEVVSLQCYVCNSLHFREDCASTDKLVASDKFHVNCTELPDGERYTYCRKMVHQFSHEGGVETRVVRQCGYMNTTMNICQKTGMHKDGAQLVCSCDTDNCNGSSQLHSEKAIFSLFTLAAVVYLI
ncbi:uncharacterized protein LOC130701071 [Daphnia carinata]|uniref:uncharacterized protein LOC130701071 n=1 Tax=Daphnia carinata TaxID=120202 RepID=UPI00257E058F|nr:uncharacterized protein LOC130701071 [Daphnia carinata]